MNNMQDEIIIDIENPKKDDFVSREAIIDLYDRYRPSLATHISEFGDELKKLPSAKKTEHWIPVSEGLPKEGKTVIASSEYGVYPEARYTKEDGWEWAYEAGADYWEPLECVQAWMPLPKQYKPQESEE